MAIPVVENFSVGEQDGAGTTVTTARPAGLAANEMVFFLHGSDQNRTLTAPSDAISQDERQNGTAVTGEISYLIAGASEPTQYSAGIDGGSDDQILGALRISGFNSAIPIHKSEFATGFNATPTCPDLVTEVDNCLIVRAYVADGNDIAIEDAGYPSGISGLFNRETASPSSVSVGIAHEDKAAQGAVGPASFSLANSEEWIAWTVAIPESPGSAGNTEGAALHHHLQRLGAR